MKPYKRISGWPAALDAYVERHRCMPFAWGVHDCCQFPRGAIKAITRRDPSKGWRLGRYRTARGAAKVLVRLGGIENLPDRAGLVEIPVARAGRGDVMLCRNDGRLALGVCIGQHCAAPGATGLVFVPALECLRAWRVG